jgi:hypothetical protein
MPLHKMLRKTGNVLLAIGALLTFAAAVLASVGSALDKESKAFVDASVPAIVSGWDIGELQKRASDEFNNSVDNTDMKRYFAILRKMGTLREYRGSTGEAQIDLSFLNGVEVTALYSASADFDEGAVDLQLSLIKQKGQWQILGIRITPRELADDNNTI